MFWHKLNCCTKIIQSVLIFLLVLTIIISLGIYWGNWRSPIISKVINLIPYPAALINGKIVTLKNILQQEKILTKIQTTLPESIKNNNSITTQALAKVIELEVLNQSAKQFGIIVSDEEVAQYMRSIVNNLGSPVAIENIVQKEYDWDLKTYVENIVKPIITQQKLETYWETISPNKEAHEKIQELYNKASLDPKKFEELATLFNQDQTAAVKGELGWLSYGDMAPELQKVIITLNPGEISPIITTEQGYHILKVGQKTSDNQGREVWQAYQIFFKRYSFGQYLAEAIKKAKIISLLKL